MSLFEIPVCIRIISVGKIYLFGKETEAMCLDGVGFFLHYDKEWQKKDYNFIRQYVPQKINEKIYIESESIHKALKKFYDKQEGAKTGGEKREAKAIWIDEKKFIYELPFCPKMNKNREGDFVCICEYNNNDDEECDMDGNRMCVLEDREPPKECVISVFRDCTLDYGEKELNRAARHINGLKFVELRVLTHFQFNEY